MRWVEVALGGVGVLRGWFGGEGEEEGGDYRFALGESCLFFVLLYHLF